MVDADSRELISPLVFPGSLGAGSYNTQFAGLAAASIEANGGTVDSGTMGDFDCPSYNADTRDFGFATGTEDRDAGWKRWMHLSSRRLGTTRPCPGGRVMRPNALPDAPSVPKLWHFARLRRRQNAGRDESLPEIQPRRPV